MNKINFKIEGIKKIYIKDLWRLRNDKRNRKSSTNNKHIKLNDHLSWFRNIDQKKIKIFIAIDTRNKKVIGYVRFEIKKISAEVSIAIYKKYQLKGLSKKMLYICEKNIKTHYFTAKVHNNNVKSIALFKSLNYKSTNKKGNFLIMKKKTANSNKYLKIIQQIEDVRKKNNSNWMDILRIAFKNSPEASAKIMGEIYSQDKKIGILSKKLSKKL